MGNAIPGQFGTVALSPIIEVAPLVQREVGPFVNTVRRGVPFPVVIK